MNYTLYNKRLRRPLIHPQVGLWFTDDRKEAEELLADFQTLCQDIGRPEVVGDLEVREITGEGVSPRGSPAGGSSASSDAR